MEKEKLLNAPIGSLDHLITNDSTIAVLHHIRTEPRQVILLRYLEGKTAQEVAEITGKPIAAVKSLQHRALIALHQLLYPAEYGMD